MAWRVSAYLVEGELDNTRPGRITGWMQFAGIEEKVVFDLEGNFHRDIRGAKIHFQGDACEGDVPTDAESYMEGFSALQTGKAGDITAGREPVDYVNYPYIEWYSHENGRVLVELEPVQLEVMGQPIPAQESDPISRKEQAENMAEFLCGVADAMGIPDTHSVSTGDTVAVEQAKKVVANDKIRGMKLLPKEIREQLPALYAQDGKGGKAVVYVKFFTPSSSWTWWVTEGSPITDNAGREVDFQFFGLVEGHCRELGYFNLSELESVRTHMGLPIERDLYWRPRTLEEIAPEMFSDKQGD